jgi:hypothetical protein
MPTWPFYAVAWIGDVVAVVLIGLRAWRLVFAPDTLQDAQYDAVHPVNE